jgi:predicted Rossmann fold flavoprotein
MAAISSAGKGAKSVICESNSIAGKKLLLTGAGRCNLTHASDIKTFIKAFDKRSFFVRHCLYEFKPDDLRKFLANLALPTKVEKDGCVFPASERSSDVRDVLVKEALKLKIVFLFNNPVLDIEKKDELFYLRCEKQNVTSKKLIIATGGLSYPQTGSKGDGYRFAASLGHKIIHPKPALVPLVTAESWPASIAGLSLSNIKISAKNNKKINCIGDLIFTHNGIGGPAALDFSRLIIDTLSADKKPLAVSIDTLADISETELEKRFLEMAEKNPKKTVRGILALLYPQRFALVLCGEFGFDENCIGRQLKKDERKRLLKILKALPLTIIGTGPIEEAIITRGGVSTDQINPLTCESLVCRGLYFAGEVIDIDGPSGGFNLQFAFSSGVLAGTCAAKGTLK